MQSGRMTDMRVEVGKMFYLISAAFLVIFSIQLMMFIFNYLKYLETI